MRSFLTFTADLLAHTRTKECGCIYRKLPVPVGGINEAWTVIEHCDTHKGDK